MEIFVLWLIFSIIVAVIGSNRKIGGFLAFLISIFLSPLIGLIVVLFSKDKQTDMLENQMLQQSASSNIETNKSVADELIKIVNLKESGTITEEEFNNMKRKLLQDDDNTVGSALGDRV